MKITKTTKNIGVSVSIFLLSAVVVYGQTNPILTNNGGRSFSSLVSGLVNIMDKMVGILVAASLLLFFWGLAKFVYASGDAGEHLRGRQLMVWGVVIFFVMGSLWGIIQFMSNSIFST